MSYSRIPAGRSKVPAGLPEFEVAESGTGLMVRCTRGRCGRAFGVTREWLESHELGTRPCPYCFATSRIPATEGDGAGTI